MISLAFHRWERRLAAIDTTRVVRPFEWGLDWLGLPEDDDPLARVKAWAAGALADSDAFYAAGATSDYELRQDVLRFPSAVRTPYPVNDTVVARVFRPDRRRGGILVDLNDIDLAFGRRPMAQPAQDLFRFPFPLLSGHAEAPRHPAPFLGKGGMSETVLLARG